ncbi:TadE/TadG family type IV pilus assembly protein [Parafrankia sp. EUN1f]|uniref:TadE/TadG family type IV pilus assembly protein n=1 Tax=Parafrankia sp. EUN1f TaxID=102897 RepID=UPI0001C45200|nr:TadE/TadG family type IV pilus assembly protein [Parafrankia sp. EUN1f]EFC82843.1 TadE family protein [Parafrankia sp. EUN1f]
MIRHVRPGHPPRRPPRVGRQRSADVDRGSFAVEFAVGWTVLLLALVVLAVAFTVPYARATVRHAARESARAAALALPQDAYYAADATAQRLLAGGVCEEDSVLVFTDLSDYGPGGTVTVTIDCRVRLLIGAPRFVTATSEEIIDRYRGGIPGRRDPARPRPA